MCIEVFRAEITQYANLLSSDSANSKRGEGRYSKCWPFVNLGKECMSTHVLFNLSVGLDIFSIKNKIMRYNFILISLTKDEIAWWN